MWKPKKAPIKAPFFYHDNFNLAYFLSIKNLAKITSATRPTNPPSPNTVSKPVKLATTSIPNTVVPVNTYQRIATGTTAIIIDNNQPKNPVTYLITLSILI